MKQNKTILALAALMLCMTYKAYATNITLPDPTISLGGTETLASQYDDFWGYSVPLTDTYLGNKTYFNYDTKDDVLVYTGGSTKNINKNIIPGLTLEDPLAAPSGVNDNTFSGIWGKGLNPNGPVLVDSVLAYMRYYDSSASIPIIAFDMNEPKNVNEENLFLNGLVSIYDPQTQTVKASWAFDGINNGIDDTHATFDQDSYIKALGTLTLNGINFEHNNGTGHLDFMAYAPTMDLTQYTGKGYYFLADFRLSDVQNGAEQLFISGGISAYKQPPTNTIPEPATLSLFGFGLLGLLKFRRK